MKSTSRLWLVLLLLVAVGQASETIRRHIGGEWTFIRVPEAWCPSDREAIILIHGNGETVGPTGSSWERSPAMQQLMERLASAGYLLAQSNHTARPDNGMWGNEASMKSVLALIDVLRREFRVTRFHAVAVSAGNLILLNLTLKEQVTFEHAVMIAPAISLASMYRCPAGIDRVTPIAEAFRFRPLHGCPGEPRTDQSFRANTHGWDPARILAEHSNAFERLRDTRWLFLYETGDPKVIPAQNVLPFQAFLSRNRIPFASFTLDQRSHNDHALTERHLDAIFSFLDRP